MWRIVPADACGPGTRVSATSAAASTKRPRRDGSRRPRLGRWSRASRRAPGRRSLDVQLVAEGLELAPGDALERAPVLVVEMRAPVPDLALPEPQARPAVHPVGDPS